MKVKGNVDKQETGRWLNNRAENSHQPFRRRERAMIRFRRMRTLQKFVAVHASIHNHFNQERHLYSRENFKLNRAAAPLRANKRETIDWLKFTLEGAGERTHGYAFTDTTFA